jgi:hypothetical protein
MRFPRLFQVLAFSALALALSPIALPRPAAAKDLEDLIERLYGGDNKITLLPINSPPHQSSFDASAGLKKINGIKRALRGIAKNLPIDAGSASFSYEFNPATGEPERVTTEGLGPLFVQRANTVGQWHIDTAFAWTHIDYYKLDGLKVRNELSFKAPLNPVPGGNFPFENDYLDVNVRIRAIEDIFSFFFVVGLTDWLDVSAVSMLIRQDLEVRTHAYLVGSYHQFDPTPGRIVAPNTAPTDAAEDGGHETAFGFGDTLVRAKIRPLQAIFSTFFDMQAPTQKYFDFALLGTMAIPSGNTHDLLGSTGAVDFRLLGIFSHTFDEWFEPHVNLGYKWSIDGGRDDFLYAAGFAVKFTDWLTAFADISGRFEQDIDSGGTDIVDFLTGFKVNPFGNFVAGINFLVPLNEAGFRTRFIPSVAVEYVW